MDDRVLHEVVLKLIGPFSAVGETQADARNLENLKNLTRLVDHLLYEISLAAQNVSRPEASMKKIGDHASAFLREVKES